MLRRKAGRWFAIAALVFGAATVSCDDDDDDSTINVMTGRGGAGGTINVTTGVGGSGGLPIIIGPGGAPPIAGSGGIMVGAP